MNGIEITPFVFAFMSIWAALSKDAPSGLGMYMLGWAIFLHLILEAWA